ncbi:MAG: pyridoxamine 5'-phosphate oxidase family protein [Planctomycetaceae bacterium]|nr:pyridoxamine 5'-phosphate oxidase family protein [Planctomycetaceae bacterium]
MPTDPRQKLQKLLERFSQAMLVTRTADGHLRARPMALADVDEAGDLWFATARDSTKIEEIHFDRNVCVTFQDSSHYLSVGGLARCETDRDRIDELWQETWRIWYPNGKDDPALTLLVVEAHTGEYWDNSSVEGLKYLFNAGKALLSGERIEIDPEQHHKVAL